MSSSPETHSRVPLSFSSSAVSTSSSPETSRSPLEEGGQTIRSHGQIHDHDDRNSSHGHDHDDHDNEAHGANSSFFHHITYPISYTTSALLRRLSEDSAPTPLARALSANYNGLMRENAPGVFNPPARKHSPFQPPPLTPLSLEGYRESTGPKGRLLSKSLAEEIRLLVPPRLQLVDTWRLGYSLEQNGSSLKSLFGAVERWRGKRAGFVLVVKDESGCIFGAYLTDPPFPHPHYYGTGECFLWRASPLPSVPDLSSLPPPPSSDTTNMTRSTTISGLAFSKKSSSASSSSLASLDPTSSARNHHTSTGTSTPDRGIRFKAFPYTGENDFLILCQMDFLSVGGGDGKYGLWLDDSLARGISSACPTFGNERLSDEGEKFKVLGVEVWYLGA